MNGLIPEQKQFNTDLLIRFSAFLYTTLIQRVVIVEEKQKQMPQNTSLQDNVNSKISSAIETVWANFFGPLPPPKKMLIEIFGTFPHKPGRVTIWKVLIRISVVQFWIIALKYFQPPVIRRDLEPFQTRPSIGEWNNRWYKAINTPNTNNNRSYKSYERDPVPFQMQSVIGKRTNRW